MAFNYIGLKQIHETAKPYRNTNNYPYYDRNHRHKYFIPVEVNGEVEYHMHYYWKWTEQHMSVADFEQAKEHMGVRELEKWHQYTVDNDVPIPYWRKWYRADAPFGIIRSDNSIEFITEDFHQGLRMHLTDMTGKYFMRDCKSGGTIMVNHYYAPRQTYKRPVFMNMRVDLDTLEPHESSRYTIDIKTLDRKKSNELFKLHQDKFNLLETFYKAMDEESFISDIKEVVKNFEALRPNGVYQYHSYSELKNMTNDIWDSNPVEASLMGIVGMGIHNIYWVARGDKIRHQPIEYFEQFKKLFKKSLQKSNEIFNRQRYWDFDAYYPTSNWDIELRDSSGNLLKQL